MSSKQSRNNPPVTLTLTPEVIDALRELAAGSGLSLSAMVRVLILAEKKRQSATRA